MLKIHACFRIAFTKGVLLVQNRKKVCINFYFYFLGVYNVPPVVLAEVFTSLFLPTSCHGKNNNNNSKKEKSTIILRSEVYRIILWLEATSCHKANPCAELNSSCIICSTLEEKTEDGTDAKID